MHLEWLCFKVRHSRCKSLHEYQTTFASTVQTHKIQKAVTEERSWCGIYLTIVKHNQPFRCVCVSSLRHFFTIPSVISWYFHFNALKFEFHSWQSFSKFSSKFNIMDYIHHIICRYITVSPY